MHTTQPTDPAAAERAALALSQAEHRAASAYDALLCVPAAALTPEERLALDAARASAAALHRSLAARRGARAVLL